MLTRAQISSRGGKARAKSLPRSRRREIARMGWLAMVRRHFGGDQAAAKAWLTAAGRFATDPAPWNGAFRDPGPHPARNKQEYPA